MKMDATESHFQICKTLLENKIPVYVDKPISYSYKEAEELYELSKKYDTSMIRQLMGR